MSYNSDEISIAEGQPIECYRFDYNGQIYSYTSSQYAQRIGGITYREKDKIIQLNNMPDSNIYNGDIGTIERIEYDPNRTAFIALIIVCSLSPENSSNFKTSKICICLKSKFSMLNIFKNVLL